MGPAFDVQRIGLWPELSRQQRVGTVGAEICLQDQHACKGPPLGHGYPISMTSSLCCAPVRRRSADAPGWAVRVVEQAAGRMVASMALLAAN